MRIILLILILLTSIFCFGQTKRVPKNLKQAVKFLNSDCPDSLKSIIKKTPDKELKKLSYPWGSNYMTIFDWTSNENENSKIVKYLSDKGISSYQALVILIAFKHYLLEKEFDENQILKPYQEIERKWEEEDKIRFTTDSLRGIYIPKDIEDCIKQINSFWKDSTKMKAKKMTES